MNNIKGNNNLFNKKIDTYRTEIDTIDKKITNLLIERFELVKQVGELKLQSGIPAVYSPSREIEILRKLSTLIAKKEYTKPVNSIFKEIISNSRSLEQPMKVAYLGPEASFSHITAKSNFGSTVEYVPCTNVNKLFQIVEQKNVNYGVVPIENSNAGIVNDTLDCLLRMNVKICGEEYSHIHHNLLVANKMEFKKIQKLYAHPQALAQCQNWIELNLPNCELIPTASNSLGAEIVTKTPQAAAIASLAAAQLFNLHVLFEKIEDRSNNITRFVFIGDAIAEPTGNDKTSLIVSTKNRSGAIVEILEPFKEHHVSMTKLESRPSKNRLWEYVFFIDITGHIEDKQVTDALEKIKVKATFLKVLGSYAHIDDLEGKINYESWRKG